MEFSSSSNNGNVSDGRMWSTGSGQSAEFDASYEITVISREEGSGTRGAFVELLGIEQKNEAGEKVDYTTEEAQIKSSTSVVMTSVASDEYAIGYISLGSLDDSVKALQVDGAEATEENIKAGTYAVSRPFNIATKGELSEVTQDFINLILSTEGQAIVSEEGYIALDATGAFEGTLPEGTVKISGSSSVSPVMEKLKEAYVALNPQADIQINTHDSTSGINCLSSVVAKKLVKGN